VAIFKRKSDSAGEIEREIGTLEQRRAKLQDQLQQFETELAATVRERQARMVEIDADEHVDDRERVIRLRDRVADLHDALAEIGNRITETRLRLTSERDRQARQTEADVRKRQIEAAKQALAHFRTASEQLISSLTPLSGVSCEVSGAADVAARFTGFVGTGAEAALVAAAGYVAAVAAGNLPVVRDPAKGETKPAVAVPPPAPTERRLLYVHENVRWLEDGVVRTSGKW
jgi:hypothetical protein